MHIFNLKNERAKNEADEMDKRQETILTNSQTKHFLARKTFKQPDVTSVEATSDEDTVDVENEDAVEPSSQIEKSKQTVKHFEELIRNKSKASNLLKPSISGMTTPNVDSSGFATPAADVNEGQEFEDDEEEDEEGEEDEEKIIQELSINRAIDAELSFKMASLAENEKKLEELYSMQSRLSQLKSLISDFSEGKDQSALDNEAEIGNLVFGY